MLKGPWKHLQFKHAVAESGSHCDAMMAFQCHQCLKCTSFVLTFSMFFKISTYDSDSLLNTLGEYFENFPMYYFVEILS